MILAELVKVFLVSLIGLTAMFVVTDVIQEAMRRGLSPLQTLSSIPYFIPNMLPFTIPATTLFATSLVYGRMADDSEILAIRFSGMNIHRLLLPAVLLGLTNTAWTAFLYYETIPQTRVLLREHVLADAEGVMYRLVQRDGGLRQHDIDFMLYVREVQGRDMLDVIVKKHNADRTGYVQVAWASSATMRIEFRPAQALIRREPVPGKSVELKEPEDGADPNSQASDFQQREGMITSGVHELVVCMYHCNWISTDGRTAGLADYLEFATPLPQGVFGQETRGRPSTQTWNEMFRYRKEVDQLRWERIREAEALDEQSKLASGAEARRLRRKAFITREGDVRYLSRVYRGIESEMNMRPALALGCLCFALVGCPVGIGARRRDYLGVFVFCFLPAAFVYYPVLIVGMQLSNQGRVPPAVFWLPDLLMFVASIVLIKWLMKR
jgi:lipopolysaccharide export system permease protein